MSNSDPVINVYGTLQTKQEKQLSQTSQPRDSIYTINEFSTINSKQGFSTINSKQNKLKFKRLITTLQGLVDKGSCLCTVELTVAKDSIE